MFRLGTSLPTRNALLTASRRTYFYPGAGDTGIYGASLDTVTKLISYFVVFAAAPISYWSFGGAYDMSRQYAPFSSDLHLSDGTVMQGEEAVANLRIQHERIMPFMDEIKAKLEAAGVNDSH